ncbi:MAG: putative lipoprotein [Labilithrix sp.]|nr:putative lipoprotein [Labilithrix sp.]
MGTRVSGMLGRVVATCVLLGIALTATGCKKLLMKKSGADAGVSTTAAVTGQDLADEQLQEKIDEYIKCLNSLSSSIHQSRHRYLTFVPRTGPTGKEATADLYRLSVGAASSCSSGITRSKVMPPSDPKLESAGSEFSLAATDIDHLMTEMDTYYELRLFRDDKWAKGKAMHPRLMAAWERFSKADTNLHNTLDGITKPLAQRVLARIDREDGKKFRYSRKKVLINARELVEASDPVGDDDDVDPSLYTASYTELEKALDELVAYGSVHKAELANANNPAFPMAESNYTQFVKEAGDFKKAAKDYWRCLQDAPPKAKTPSGKIDLDKLGMCGSSPAWKQADEVIKQYNEFIRTSNAHQFP